MHIAAVQPMYGGFLRKNLYDSLQTHPKIAAKRRKLCIIQHLNAIIAIAKRRRLYSEKDAEKTAADALLLGTILLGG
jgi:hypothetical protein